ncbi:hypothetical protein [Bradyrhizobium arachidis]|uniref:hypothetical protein n=1 Tax=Bradyrhizobium arachidis TaxID=858423 RepID=UPI0021620246|nr:hypothetical protein [Bradyrhizobium arachidis]
MHTKLQNTGPPEITEGTNRGINPASLFVSFLQAAPASTTGIGHLAAPPLSEFYDMDTGAADIAATAPDAGTNTDNAANGGGNSHAALLQRAFEKALVAVATQVISDTQSDMDDAMSELDDG